MPRSRVFPIASADLPSPLDRLIGREADLKRAERHFQTGFERLLTITGPGGTGKTRFALALAGRLSSGFRDGVVLIDLSAQREAVQIPVEVTRVLSARGSGFAEGQSLDHMLKGKDCLLILDNLEQIAGAGEPITDLLERFPGLHLLATSRTALGIRGERRFPLLPLHCVGKDGRIGSAVELFLERARAVNPDLELTEANEPVLKRLCQRLDGLPLALELAAARSGLYSPEGLLALLERGGGLSAAGLLERHSSLERLLDWSVDLLEAYEQTLLRRLGVFAGEFDAAAATAVVGEFGVNMLEAISRLSEHNLVVAILGETPRFRLLETVRAYALEKLEAVGETAEMRDRHAIYYGSRAAAISESLHEPEFKWERTAMGWACAQFETALDWSLESMTPAQLSAATELMRALCMYMRTVNGSHPCFQQLERLIGHLPTDWLRERIDLSMILLYTTYFKDVAASLTKIEELISAAQGLEDSFVSAQLHCLSAVIHTSLGCLPENVLQWQYQSLENLKNLNTNNAKVQKASIYDVLSQHYSLAGDSQLSLSCAESALQLARECKIHYAICHCLENIALKRFMISPIFPDGQCISMLDEAIGVSMENGYKKRTSIARQFVAEIHLAFGNVEPARVHSELALAQGAFWSGPGWQRRIETLHAQISLERHALGEAWSQAAQVLRESVNEQRWVYSSLAALTLADCLQRLSHVSQSARWLGFSAHCASLTDSTLSVANDLHLKRTRAEQRERLERNLIEQGLNVTAQSASNEQVLEWLEQDGLTLDARLSEKSCTAILEQVAQPSDAELTSRLSPRETEILSLLARGQTNKHIAQRLRLSPSTIETHLKRLFLKLEVRTRAQAVSRATELGWL